MLTALGWWVLIELIGLAALPATARILRFLPARGATLSKHVGLLLSVYLYWLLCTLQVAENTAALAWFCILMLAVVSAVVVWRQRASWCQAWKEARPLWLAGEMVFGLAFVAFAIFRAYNPEIAGTEKPMEMAFINGVLRSVHFPPQDPWLSGYAISYYYGGYTLTALLTRLLGASSAITFNLTNVTLFALTASGVFGLLAELVLEREKSVGGDPVIAHRRAVLSGLLGALLVAAMGNLEGIFELLRAHGAGSEALWHWLDVRNLGASPSSAHWYPDDGWWWWRASRIIHDRDAAGNAVEVISEFPFFSFLLGDNHPHVYALPFGVLALTLSYNALLACREGVRTLRHRAVGVLGAVEAVLDGIVPGATPADWLAWWLLLGALGWFNTWDLPVHLVLFGCAAALGLWSRRSSTLDWLVDLLSLAVALGSGLLLLYLPFYWGLRSQAGGVALVPVKTQWQQFLLMFGALLWPLFGAAWLDLSRGSTARGSMAGRVWLLALGLGAVSMALMGWWVAALGLLLAGLGGHRVLSPQALSGESSAADSLVGLLVVAGSLLTVSTEFVYLRDVFDTRMNTVFKFYYQAWLLLGVAGAYGFYRLATVARGARQRVGACAWALLGALLVAGGLGYTVAASASKANGFVGEPTLDGARYIARQSPAEYEAMRWLEAQAARDATLVEATGGSYSEYNWVSAHTGIPTLLGWGGHELQWRGSYEIPGAREPDVAVFYQASSPETLRALAARHGTDYVWLGRLERIKYGVTPAAQAALDAAFVRVYENEDVVIYGTVPWGQPQ